MVDIQFAFRCAAVFTGLFSFGPGLHFLLQAATLRPADVDVSLFILYGGVGIKAETSGGLVPDKVAVFRSLGSGRRVDIKLHATCFRIPGVVMLHGSGDGAAMSFCQIMYGTPVDHCG